MVPSEDRSRASQEKSRGAFIMPGRRDAGAGHHADTAGAGDSAAVVLDSLHRNHMDPLPHADFRNRQGPDKGAA